MSETASATDGDPTKPQGKGRPTPKRSEKQRRRSGPVAPPPQTRKEASRRQKQETREHRARLREGTARGDERNLARRDAGPVRKLVRNVVDGRRSAGVLLLPVALLLVLAQFSGAQVLLDVALTLWIASLLAVFIDVVVLLVTIRRRIREQFPDERRMTGHLAYGFLRSTVFRRWRLPPATVSPPSLTGRTRT